SALLLSVNRHYGHQSLQVDLESHGREEVVNGVNISRTVGWFTGIYPVILQADAQDTGATIVQVKEALRAVPNKGIDYLLTSWDQKNNTNNRSQVIFNYLGQFDTDTQGKSYGISTLAKGDEQW